MDQSIHWYQSRTILATLISAVCSLLGMFGHAIDADTQSNLTAALFGIINGLAVIAAIVTAYYRTQVTAPIKGSAVATQVAAQSPTPPT